MDYQTDQPSTLSKAALRALPLLPTMSLLAPLIEAFRYSLQPIAPFTWLGWNISTLDVVATVRLCIVLRQIREITLKQHVAAKGTGQVEVPSFVRKATATLLVVYGGEAVICALHPCLLTCCGHLIGLQLLCWACPPLLCSRA